MSITVRLGEVVGSVTLYGAHVPITSLDIEEALNFSIDQHMYLTCTGLRHTGTREIIPMAVDKEMQGATSIPENFMNEIEAGVEYELVVTGTI